MSFRIPFASIGSSMEGFCNMFNITEDDLVYLNDELTDEPGDLLKDKVYFFRCSRHSNTLINRTYNFV